MVETKHTGVLLTYSEIRYLQYKYRESKEMTDECQGLHYCRSLKDVANVFKPFSAAGSLCDPTPEIFLDAESLW